jgi:hypothetical protein
MLGGIFAFYLLRNEHHSHEQDDRNVKQNRWRDSPLQLPPAAELGGFVSRTELARVVLFMQPRWKVVKTNMLMHAFRLWGSKSEFANNTLLNPFHSGSPSGRAMLRTLLDESSFLDARIEPTIFFLTKTELGVDVRYDSEWGSGDVAHCDQFLKVLAEAGISADHSITWRDGANSVVSEIIRCSLANFRLQNEPDFTSVAYSLWLPPAYTWHDRFGERYSLDQLAISLLDRPLGDGSCCGIHALYALACLYRANTLYPVLPTEVSAKIEDYFTNASRILEKSQLPSGAWQEDWAKIKISKPESKSSETVLATGHHLEWIATVPPALRPNRKTIERAARFLTKIIPEHDFSTIAASYAPFSHATRALMLLEKTNASEFLHSSDYLMAHPR